MKRVLGWHELAHKIRDTHASVCDLIRCLPEDDVYKGLHGVCLDFRAEAENKLIVAPEQILKEDDNVAP